ncbi:MAG: hypothetical protein K9I47_09810 [Bacteroidales bacterium]|nr:hypothetical protein [Bacteroidales bacterium]
MRVAPPPVTNVGTFGRADLSGWQRFPNNLLLARFSGLLVNTAADGKTLRASGNLPIRIFAAWKVLGVRGVFRCGEEG